MGKVLQRRVIAATLTLASAAIVFVLLVPIASGGNPPGRDQITGYGTQNGQSTTKVKADQLFDVFGKKLNHVIHAPAGVWCWSQMDNAWVALDWGYGRNSKTLLTYASSDCVGNNSAIRAEFDDGTLVVGPRLAIG